MVVTWSEEWEEGWGGQAPPPPSWTAARVVPAAMRQEGVEERRRRLGLGGGGARTTPGRATRGTQGQENVKRLFFSEKQNTCFQKGNIVVTIVSSRKRNYYHFPLLPYGTANTTYTFFSVTILSTRRDFSLLGANSMTLGRPHQSRSTSLLAEIHTYKTDNARICGKSYPFALVTLPGH
jgi:hypothetical protein